MTNPGILKSFLLLRLPPVLLAAGWLLATPAVRAQSLDNSERRWFASDTLYSRTWGDARTIEHGSAAQLVRNMQAQKRITTLTVSRVRIFFDNSQNARARASATAARFREMYPDIPVYVVYDNPSWKVTVGNCLTPEEVIILQGRIQRDFDIAFLVREAISLSKFAE